MTLHKLKVAALQHEQREDWGAAIELYRQAIREAEGGAEGGDPSLYNRVGDLAHKAGDDAAACEAWEQAVSRYADLGFLNSAIALCGKILRLDPRRVHTFLELARLQARKRVLYDVRQNLRLYVDQMGLAGRADAARTALTKFGDEFRDWRDLEQLLDEMLGRERASGDRAGTGAEAGGPGASGLVFLDTAPLRIERASEPDMTHAGGGDSSVVGGLEFEPRPDDAPLAGLETNEAPSPTADASGGAVEGLVGITQAARDAANVQPLDGLDVVTSAGTASVGSVEGLEQTSSADAAADDAGATIGGDLVFLQTDATPDSHAPPIDDALGTRVTAHALLEHGDRAGGIAALDAALLTYQEQGEWLHAYQVATELIAAEPAAIGRYQARVEIAARMRDPARLCEAYVELGDALVREGGEEKAVAVYRRVLELDDANPRARAALRAMGPAAVEAPSEFIDLGAMLIDDHPRSTRMRTETPDVDADENETFRDALAEFRRALDQNLPIEDHQAHYDLGIAFKEMGLLDEAISEFQKALRAPEVRLRTSEALGEVFFDQGRPAVAEAVLRGVENSAEGDAEKIGVLYWLGRSLEAQDKRRDAIGYYQRIVAVDVSFRDVGERLNQVTGDTRG